MTRTIRIFLTLAALILAAPLARATERVDLLLILASDVSRSVDQAKFKLQRDGYIAALSDKRVLDAIGSGRHQRIAVCFVEWSGVSAQKLLIDWMVIDGPDSARKFGDNLLELPRSFAERTSISGAIDLGSIASTRRPSPPSAGPSADCGMAGTL